MVAQEMLRGLSGDPHYEQQTRDLRSQAYELRKVLPISLIEKGIVGGFDILDLNEDQANEYGRVLNHHEKVEAVKLGPSEDYHSRGSASMYAVRLRRRE